MAHGRRKRQDREKTRRGGGAERRDRKEKRQDKKGTGSKRKKKKQIKVARLPPHRILRRRVDVRETECCLGTATSGESRSSGG